MSVDKQSFPPYEVYTFCSEHKGEGGGGGGEEGGVLYFSGRRFVCTIFIHGRFAGERSLGYSLLIGCHAIRVSKYGCLAYQGFPGRSELGHALRLCWG